MWSHITFSSLIAFHQFFQLLQVTTRQLLWQFFCHFWILKKKTHSILEQKTETNSKIAAKIPRLAGLDRILPVLSCQFWLGACGQALESRRKDGLTDREILYFTLLRMRPRGTGGGSFCTILKTKEVSNGCLEFYCSVVATRPRFQLSHSLDFSHSQNYIS